MGKDWSVHEPDQKYPCFYGRDWPVESIAVAARCSQCRWRQCRVLCTGRRPDQNLIILDDAVVYNPGHLFGFFSVFNSDAIKNVSLIKGGMPAQYGGRLSSVVDVTMKDGNSNRLQMDGGIGLVASRFSIQGPLKNKASLLFLHGAHTLMPSSNRLLRKAAASMVQAITFMTWMQKWTTAFLLIKTGSTSVAISEEMCLILSVRNDLLKPIYPGATQPPHAGAGTMYSTAAYLPTPPWCTMIINSNSPPARETFEIGLSSGIKDGTIKTDFDYYPLPNHKLKFGGSLPIISSYRM